MTEFLYADTHITGDFPNPNNALGNTPSTWAGGPGGSNTTHVSRWGMEDPEGLIAAASSTARFLVRKTEQSSDPNVTVTLFVNGSSVRTLVNGVNVSSTTGTVLSAAILHSTDGIGDGSGVEFQVTSTTGGGPGGNRAHVQIAYLEWELETEEPPELRSASFLFEHDTDVSVSYDSMEFDAASASLSFQHTSSVVLTAGGFTFPAPIYVIIDRAHTKALTIGDSERRFVTYAIASKTRALGIAQMRSLGYGAPGRKTVTVDSARTDREIGQAARRTIAVGNTSRRNVSVGLTHR